MSNRATRHSDKLDKSKTTTEGFEQIEFNPVPLFSPSEVRLASPDGVPARLPVSFVLVAEIDRGNIRLRLQDLKFNSPPPNPAWKIQSAMINATDASSIVLQDNLGDLLVLTGALTGTELKGTWSSKVANCPASGAWSSQLLGGNTVFCSRFSWTFLLDPGKKSADDTPETVILEFDIFVGPGSGTLQQVSSFPVGWIVTGFEDTDKGILLAMTGPPPDNEKYCLQGGLFVGGLDALVCQGAMTIGTGCDQTAKKFVDEGDGTWTGTSSGPI